MRERPGEPLPEKSKMAKLASPKQLAYIERLAAECHMSVAKPLEELTMQKASEIIDELVEKANGGSVVAAIFENKETKDGKTFTMRKAVLQRTSWIRMSSGKPRQALTPTTYPRPSWC